MPTINLKTHYPHIREDTFIDVSDEIYEVILLSIRQENNYNARTYYHKAYYSLNCDDGIENEALHRMPSPEEMLLQQVTTEQLYQALNALPPIQARRVYKRYILKLKGVEIARQENVNENSIRQAVVRGIEGMKKYYANKDWL